MSKNNAVKNFFLILTALAGLIAVFPQIIYQPFLLQGDHGRDLYQFQQTALGAVPYLDYSTDNGPLMPFYYALFLNLAGDSLQSVLLGYALMIFAAGLVIFLISKNYLTPFMAFLAALWYWTWRGQEFFYTFNHIGALTTGLIVLMFTIKAVEKNEQRLFFSGLFWSLMTFLIRPDIGIAALAGLSVCSILFQQNSVLRNKHIFVISMISLAGILILLNIILPQLLTPYLSSIEWSHFTGNITALFQMWFNLFRQNVFTLIVWAFMSILVTIGIMNLLKKTRSGGAAEIKPLACILIFTIFFSAEYLLGSRFFRWVWIMPFLFLTIFVLVDQAVRTFPKWLRVSSYTLIALICLTLILSQYASVWLSHQNQVLMQIGKTRILMDPTQKAWINTVEQTTQMITENTDPCEPIITLPYDGLYAFLSGHQLATRRTDLFNVSTDTLIEAIQRNNVRLIVISNRAFRHNETDRFGILGKDYGTGFMDYLNENFQLIGEFGPWNQPATAINNHAARVYLRPPESLKQTN